MITLNDKQTETLQGLRDWFLSDAPAANFTGTAGTGKTTLTCMFINELLESGEKVQILAPTHAALIELASRLPEDCIFMTVAQATGQAPLVSNTVVETMFIRRSSKDLDGTIIVDESSMLGKADVEILMAQASKILFVGDRNQIKPVKKLSGSDILYDPEIMPQFVLTEVVRSNDRIAKVAQKASKVSQFVPDSNEEGDVVYYDNMDEFTNAFLDDLITHNVGDVAFITRTNEEVQKINELGFNHLYPNSESALPSGLIIRLGLTSPLGKNNTLAKVLSSELTRQADGISYYILTVRPDSPRTAAALPNQYKLIEKRIGQLVTMFQDKIAGEGEEIELDHLRSIVPIDYPYAMTSHRSQGKSIPVVYANSNALSGRSQFFVAYSRASQKLCVVRRIQNTKGSAFEIADNTVWVNKKTGDILDIDQGLIQEASTVAAAIAKQFPDKTEIHPSVSHIACVLNRSHASKSAKGWTLTEV